MFALGLLLTLAATPSARLLTDDELLSPAEVLELDRELRILNGNIQLLKPRMPPGFVVGIAVGFALSGVLLPGVPLLIAGVLGAFSSASLLFAGGLLTVVGGVALAVALLCLVLGNDAESDLAVERKKLVERRDELKRRLAPYQPPPGYEPKRSPVSPGYVPGVQLQVPAPRLLTLARF